MQKWQRLSTEIAYDSRYFRVKKDLVKIPDGSEIEWTYWDSPDSAMVIGMTAEKKLVTIRQYRYLTGQVVTEFPSGRIEEGETPRDCARREFEEETGYAITGALMELGSFYETYGQLNRRIHFFFANEITEGKQKLDPEEEIEIGFVSLDEAVRMAENNELISTPSALIILLLNQKLANK